MSYLDHSADDLNRQELNRISAEKSGEEQAAQHLCHDAYDFQGLDLGIIKIGSQNCSAVFGVDLGIAHAGVSLGEHTGVEAGVGVPGLGADAGVGATIGESGVRAGAAGGAEVGPIVGAGVGVGAAIGERSGVGAAGGAYVGPIGGAGVGDTYVDRRGIHAGAGAGIY